jgi:hypothetical protein
MKRHAIGPEAIPFGMGIVGIDLSPFANEKPLFVLRFSATEE